MKAFILGKKGRSEQFFNKDNQRLTVTRVNIPDCYLTQIKTFATDGYWALQIGCLQKSPKNVNKVTSGQAKKAGVKTPLSFFREIRLKNSDAVKEISEEGKKGLQLGERKFFLGQKLNPTELFKEEQTVEVTGKSKGKGFAGVVKRHRFAGGPKTHGQSDRERHPGSIGNRTIPGRVFKGKRMAGRTGGDTINIKGLKVIAVSEKELVLSGLLPGAYQSLVVIESK